MNIALFSLLIFIIILLIIVPIIFDIFRGLNKRNMRVHLINSKQEIRKLWNNRPAQNEGPMIFGKQ